jgi:hypothetical protein
MTNISSYIQDTEANIYSKFEATDGQIAFATDTKNLFIGNNGVWSKYTSDIAYSDYNLNSNYNVSLRPIYHIDASDQSYLRTASGSLPNHLDKVEKIICKSTGKEILNSFEPEQPKYISSSSEPPLGKTDGTARIAGKNVLQFGGSALYHDRYAYGNFLKTDGQTIALVVKISPENLSNWDTRVSIAANSWRSGGLDLYYRSANKHLYPASNGLGLTRNLSSFITEENNIPDTLIYFSRILTTPHGYSYDVCLTKSGNLDKYNKYVSTTQTATYIGLIAGLWLGSTPAHNAQPTSYLKGEFGEFIQFPKYLNDQDFDSLGQYMTNKWGEGGTWENFS